jgi:hypothetical protein
MKRFFVCLVCLLHISIYTNAQKVDLDKYHFSYTCRHLPDVPLPADFKTYNIVINAAANVPQLA